MCVMVVGGDYIESIKKRLLEAGVVKIYHVNGRKVGDTRREIPGDVDIVIFLCDFVSHNLVRSFKKEAKRKGIPVIFSRRSISQVLSRFEKWKGDGK